MRAPGVRGGVGAALTALALLATSGGAAAAAATWSAPEVYDRAPASCLRHGSAVQCVTEPAPRVAVNARGAAVAAWVDTRDRVRAAVATRPGRFGAAVTLASKGLRPSVAIAPDGAVTVAWSARGGVIAFRQRPAGRAAFGPVRTLAPRAGRRNGDDSPRLAAQADGSVVAAYESGVGVRTVTISPSGRPGPARTLGPGGFGHDSTRAAPDGTLALCCTEPVNADPNVPADTAIKVALFRPRAGWQIVPAGAVGRDAIESVFATSTDLVLGTIAVADSGDAGLLGVPSLARAAGDGMIGAPLRAPVDKPGRGLAPSVAVDGSRRAVLVFQEKARSQAFSRDAPVYASVAAPGATALSGRRRLFAGQGYEPAVRPLGAGAMAVWQQSGPDRWGVAIERDGVFRHVAAPRGPGPSRLGEDFNYAHDLAAAGGHAVLAWTTRDGAVRVSEWG